MKYGIEESEWAEIRQILSQTPAISEAILYGSRAKGTQEPFSDVDMTLVGDQLTEEDLTDVQFRLSESLLPYFFDVSLYKNLKSHELIEHIKRRGQVVYKQ